MIKRIMTCGLIAWSICLVTIDAGAAAKRSGMNRCTYANCFRQLTPGAHSSKQLRRHRPTEDAVSRLQNKIAREQAMRRQELAKDRKQNSYSAHRRYAYSPLLRMSCRRGRQLVQRQGFYRVNALECQGRTFTYLARENGKTVRVTVDSRFGRIIGTRPF